MNKVSIFIIALFFSVYANAEKSLYLQYEETYKNGNEFKECYFNENGSSEIACLEKIQYDCNQKSGTRDISFCWGIYKNWTQKRLGKLLQILDFHKEEAYINSTQMKLDSYIEEWCEKSVSYTDSGESSCKVEYNLKRIYDLENRYCYMGRCFTVVGSE